MKGIGFVILMALFLWPNISMADISSPIQVSLNISHVPLVNETADVTCTVTSSIDAPNTTAKILLPRGAKAINGSLKGNWDLKADVPEHLIASIKFTQTGDQKIEAIARQVLDSNKSLGWGDIKALYLTIGSEVSLFTPPPTHIGQLIQARLGTGKSIESNVTNISIVRMNEILKAASPPISNPVPIGNEAKEETKNATSLNPMDKVGKKGADNVTSNAKTVFAAGEPDIHVTLFWNDHVDLDLWVQEPGGEWTGYTHMTSATGGTLDRDNRCSNWILGAPENIIWPEGKAPNGVYCVYVNYFEDCTSNHPNPIPYTLKVNIKGQEHIFNGQVSPPATPGSHGQQVWCFNYPNVNPLTLKGNIGYYTQPGDYRGNDNTRVNAKYFLVKLFDGNGFPINDGEGYTDSNGNFVISIANPGAIGVRPVLYAYHKWKVGEISRTQMIDREMRVVSQGTSLTGLADVYSWALKNPQVYPDGIQDLGVLEVPKGDPNEAACWLLDDLNRAYLYPPSDPGSCTIFWYPSYQGYNENSYFDSGGDKQVHICGVSEHERSSDTVIHEVGHNFMYNVYGGHIPPNPGCNPHWIWRASSQGCAWTEGFADFFPLAVNGNPIYTWSEGSGIDLETRLSGWDYGDAVEGRVAGALWDLLDNTPDEGSDGYFFDINPIWDTTVNGGNSVNTFQGFWNIWLSKSYSIYAINCLMQNYIYYYPEMNVALSASNGQYVSAENGGGHGLSANRPSINGWEIFTAIDLGNSNIALRTHNGRYVCAENGGGSSVMANRNHFDGWETFKLVDQGLGNYALQTSNGHYLSAVGSGGAVDASSNTISSSQKFRIVALVSGKCALQASNGQFVSAEGGGGGAVVANRNQALGWETFKLVDQGLGNYALQAANGQYVCAENGGGDGVVANRDWVLGWEKFGFIYRGDSSIALQASNGQFVSAEGGGGGAVVANRPWVQGWETFKFHQM